MDALWASGTPVSGFTERARRGSGSESERSWRIGEGVGSTIIRLTKIAGSVCVLKARLETPVDGLGCVCLSREPTVGHRIERRKKFLLGYYKFIIRLSNTLPPPPPPRMLQLEDTSSLV